MLGKISIGLGANTLKRYEACRILWVKSSWNDGGARLGRFCNLAQLVELQTINLTVAGSIPATAPKMQSRHQQ